MVLSTSFTALVSGATGNQGGAVARALLDRGHRVRALTRNPDSAPARALEALGAEAVGGDFDGPGSLRRAAAGADSAFVMGTPFGTDPETETRQSIALIDAAYEARVAHVTYSSVASALDGTGIPHFESKAAVETHLGRLDLASTVLAPAAFLPDLVSPDALRELREGRYSFPLPGDVAVQRVAMPDVGAFAALVLEQPRRFIGERIELASVAATGNEIAAALSAHLADSLGHDVRYEEIPLAALREQMEDDGLAMFEFFRGTGYGVDIPALRMVYPEVAWHGLDGWIRAHDWAAVL